MKSTIHKVLTLLLVTTLLASCNINILNRINGNRNVVTEDRTTSEEFTKIKVSTGLDLYITQGSETKITLEADENLHDFIITEVNDGVLKIYSEKNIWNAKARKVYVTLNKLEAIVATSGADVYADEIIKTDDIEVSASSGADIRISLDANNVETNSTSGADIKISGKAANHISSATSGASISAFELRSNHVTVNVSSGADIDIFASESIKANANSGGDIDYKGNPEKVSKSSNSGGSISAK